jgi:hypothetical protein
LAAISAVSVRSGNLMRKVMRGLSLGALMASSSVASSVVAIFSRVAVSVPHRGGRVSNGLSVVPVISLIVFAPLSRPHALLRRRRVR